MKCMRSLVVAALAGIVLAVAGCKADVTTSGGFSGYHTSKQFRFTNLGPGTVAYAYASLTSGGGSYSFVDTSCTSHGIFQVGDSCTVTVTQEVAGTPPAGVLRISTDLGNYNFNLP
jgi:hypothetical protein